MRNVLSFDPSKCIGCLFCEMICSSRHKNTFSRSDSLIKIISDEKTIEHEAMFCAHCDPPVCAKICRLDAIIIDKETGQVSVDTAKCTGCGLCVSGCPLGGMSWDNRQRVATNCDLCDGSPACVEFCPSGALEYSLSSSLLTR